MFDEHEKHEQAIRSQYLRQTKAEQIRRNDGFVVRLKLRKKNGATIFHENKHLDRRVARVYPRGPAFERIIELIPS